MGKKTVKVKSQSSSIGQHQSSSENISFQSRALMMPDEIIQMSKSDQIILVAAESPGKAKKMNFK